MNPIAYIVLPPCKPSDILKPHLFNAQFLVTATTCERVTSPPSPIPSLLDSSSLLDGQTPRYLIKAATARSTDYASPPRFMTRRYAREGVRGDGALSPVNGAAVC
ncbi:hypothetical protein CDAR_460921 [Caerostris darwini]|uniref:Uncharacterized protein n=1 Tax=Caerostris darwini TaxID=1538125 RepID=A0AAV4R5E2_9ARAC|nr:hypothetical protein CDAR_460921 [Caerostris darwini]